MKRPYTIAVVGLWHLGEVYSACLAELGHKVVGISDDTKVIANFKKNIPPLIEPRVPELLLKNQKAGNLSYTTDWEAIRSADVVWISFDTPVNEKDEVDISPVTNAIKKALPLLKQNVVLAISSQIPVGTSKKICDSIRKARPELSFSYFYAPENLRINDAVRIFLEPEHIVLGYDSHKALDAAKEIYGNLSEAFVAMSPESAEMTKHAINVWNSVCTSFTNDLADLCEATGADVEDLIRAFKKDQRFGKKTYLFAGTGYSGASLARDVKALLKAARAHKLKVPVIEGADKKNNSRGDIVRIRLAKTLGKIKGKTVALFGVTFKAGTSTLRRSRPLEIEAQLRKAGARVRLYDPMAIPAEVGEQTPSPFFRDPYEAARGADIVLIMTPSPDYRSLDFKKLKRVMSKPLLFDTCNILPSVEKELSAAGLSYMRVGR